MKPLAKQISEIEGVNIYGGVAGARTVIETGGNHLIRSGAIGFTGSKRRGDAVRRTRRRARGCRAAMANAASQMRLATDRPESRIAAT